MGSSAVNQKDPTTITKTSTSAINNIATGNGVAISGGGVVQNRGTDAASLIHELVGGLEKLHTGGGELGLLNHGQIPSSNADGGGVAGVGISPLLIGAVILVVALKKDK